MSIGVFDSGSGGLTILDAYRSLLPNEDFIYLGDHARAPYGDKAPDDVYRFTIEMVERLFDEGANLVLLACNTAAAVALRRLQQEWLPHTAPDRRVLGVFVPMIEALTGAPWAIDNTCGCPTPSRPRRRVAIFATQATVDSQAFPREVALRAPHIDVAQRACPGLVEAIEADAQSQQTHDVVAHHVDGLLNELDGGRLDAAVLGCTHYPLAYQAFAAALPQGLPIYSQPEIAAQSLKRYLERHPRFRTDGLGTLKLLTTGKADAISTFPTLSNACAQRP